MLIKSPKSLELSRRKLLTGAAVLAAMEGISKDQALAQICGTYAPTVPPAAAGAGYTKLVFSDDFNVLGTVAPAATTGGTGYNWFWAYNVNSSFFTVTPTATAATVATADGLSAGGGPNASPNGGIISFQENCNGMSKGSTCNPPGGTYFILISMAAQSLDAPGSVLPPVGQGHWRHFYAEAYLYADIDGNTDYHISGNIGWPSWWAWSAQGLEGYGGGSTITTSAWNEVDFWEMYGTEFGVPHGTWTSTFHQNPGNANIGQYYGTPLTDNNWHTVGFLWSHVSGTGAQSVGTMATYIDNVLAGVQVNGGGPNPMIIGYGHNNQACEVLGQSLFVGLSSGWPLYCDWVRIWQPPTGANT